MNWLWKAKPIAASSDCVSIADFCFDGYDVTQVLFSLQYRVSDALSDFKTPVTRVEAMTKKKGGRATKGSQLCLQNYVNQEPSQLADLIISQSPSMAAFAPQRLHWVSPLQDENYYEYRDDFLQALQLEENAKQWREFWPAGGPQWDALAIAEHDPESLGVVLVEAKGHPGEACASTDAKDKGLAKIQKSLSRVIGFCEADTLDVKKWTHGYYQVANRIAALYFLNEVLGLEAWLVLVNFVNDTSHKPTKIQQWRESQVKVMQHLGVHSDSPLLHRVSVLCIEPIPSA